MIDQIAKEKYNGYDAWEMYCDFCDESQTFENVRFTIMVEEAKDGSWTVGKDKDGWWHKCPECSKKEKEKENEPPF